MVKKNPKADVVESGRVQDDDPCVATIVFIDIVGCSTISNVKGVKDYGNFLEEFEDIAEKRIKAILSENYLDKTQAVGLDDLKYLKHSVRGDEACVILFSDHDPKIEDKESARTNDAYTAIEIAVKIKEDWLACPYNQKQLDDGKPHCSLGIGINSGPVHVKEKNGELFPEGYAINLAKRIEGESRRGKYSGIIVGQLTKSFYDDGVGESEAFFDDVEMAELKGILQAVPTYEIKYYTYATNVGPLSKRSPFPQDEKERVRAKELREWTEKARDANRSSAWLANIYGNQSFLSGKYDEAERAFLELRNAHPKDAEPLCLLGNVYGEKGEYQNEKECYKKAIKINPYVPEWHYYLGQCLWGILLEEEKQGLKKEKSNEKISDILKCFDEAIYLSPKFSWAYYEKACVLNYYGRKGDAQKELNTAISLDEDCEIAAKSEKQYLRGLQGGPEAK